MTKHIAKRRARTPQPLCPISITPFLHRVKREWLTACLQQTPAGFPRHFLLYGRCRFQSMCFLLLRSFSPVLARKISSQHQTSTAPFLTCGRNRATPALPCSLLHFPTSTPKPRAEGSSPSAPAKNREASTMLASLFFVSAHKDSATRHGCAPRSACRGGLQPGGLRPGPTEAAAETSPSAPATKPAETLGFCRFSFCTCRMGMGSALVQTPGFLTQLYPFSTVPIPSSTQNAPGFALFGPNRVRFSLFCCFLAAKFSPWFLCNLPHSVYKLKPSVIPCRREVSFLT